jgi:hypothetical protein
MAEVFISYKRQDQDLVQRLVQGLRGAGLDVWWDRDIEPTAPWELTIEGELEGAKAVIVAWSSASVVSENVKAEARRARHAGKLVQVFLEPCEPPLFFGERQGVDLGGWKGDPGDHRFQALLTAARAVVAGKSPPEGVGYARAPRRWNWPIAAAALAASVAGLILVLAGARTLWPAPTPAAPATDPVAAAAQARQKLLQAVAGTWDRPGGACATPIAIGAATNAAGVTTVTVSGPNGFRSISQVITAVSGEVMARDIDGAGGGAGETWEYQPNGALMTVIDGKGVHTPLVRCPAK